MPVNNGKETSEYDKFYAINFRKDDIFVVSYPRSGNTWTRFIIANLINRNRAIINFRNIESFVPDIHKSFDRLEKYQSPRFIKSHTQHFHLFPKFIYIIRDGRDALVSFYHYHMDWKAFEGNFSDYLRSRVPVEYYGDWSDHTKNALEAYSKNPDRILLLSYEKMITDTYEAVRKIADFCNIKANEADIQRTVENCSFEKLQEIEENFGSEIENMQMIFFRQGECNQWRKYYSKEDHEYFLKYHSDMLIRNGYNIDYKES
jgi:hypothetical protein